MLKLESLTLAAGNRTLFRDLTLHLDFGKLIAILGPNGVGKSTLLNHMSGVAIKTSDTVFLRGDDLFSMPVEERALRIASIAQHDTAPLETLAQERIAQGLYARRKSLSAKQTWDALVAVSSSLLLNEVLERPLWSLSGGQRKKVHIARALVDTQAEVYVLDEPDASLDAFSRGALMTLLRARAETGKLVVVSMHHHELANAYAHEVINLSSDPRFHPPEA